jgi:hypothetical protein
MPNRQVYVDIGIAEEVYADLTCRQPPRQARPWFLAR